MKPITSSHLFVVISLYALIMFLTNSWWGVIETSEARYAEIGREMLTTRDYLHPSLLSIHHYHKPPITYWFTVSGLSIFGITPQGARFFLVIAYLLQCWIVYRIALLIFDEPKDSTKDTKSIWSAFIYSNLILVLVSMRALTTDGYNHLFILFSIWMALLFKKNHELKWLYLTAIGAGFAFLTKGPVVAIVLIPIYLLVPIRKESPVEFHKVHFLLAFVLACGIGLSWYLYLVNQNKVFFNYFVMRHFIDRFVHADVFMRHQPWYFYLLIFPVLTVPWFVPFIRSINKISAVSKRILLGWVIIPFVIFSLASSKLALYILPVCAGFALVTSDVLLNSSRNYKLLFVATYLILVIGIFFVPFFDSSIQLSLIAKLTLSAAIVILVMLLLFSKEQLVPVWYSSITFTITLLVISALVIQENAVKFNSITPIAEFIKQYKLENRTVIVYNRLLPSLSFELNKSVISVFDNNSIQRETQFEPNSKWKASLFDLGQPGDSSRFSTVLDQPSVLVMKGESKNRSWIITRFKNHKTISGWNVYY